MRYILAIILICLILQAPLLGCSDCKDLVTGGRTILGGFVDKLKENELCDTTGCESVGTALSSSRIFIPLPI